MSKDETEKTLDVIRQQTEEAMARMKTRPDPINSHTASVPVPSHYEVAQTYLLLKILDRLKNIEENFGLFV